MAVRAGSQPQRRLATWPTVCAPPQTHEGYEWLYVLNGQLRLVLGDQALLLFPGEAAEFDTRTPHWFGGVDGAAVELLTLFGRQGERAHVRAQPAAE